MFSDVQRARHHILRFVDSMHVHCWSADWLGVETGNLKSGINILYGNFPIFVPREFYPFESRYCLCSLLNFKGWAGLKMLWSTLVGAMRKAFSSAAELTSREFVDVSYIMIRCEIRIYVFSCFENVLIFIDERVLLSKDQYIRI